MENKSFLRMIVSVAILLFIAWGQALAQSIEGDWYGKAEIDGIVLRLTVHVKTDGQGYSSTWDSPDQGAFGIPSTTTQFSYPDFSFTHSEAGFRYSGQVNSSYNRISGILEQAGQKLEIVFSREEIKAAQNSPEELKKKYSKKEVYIEMRDGIKLFTSIYTPRNSNGPHPILLNRTPYNIEPGGPDHFSFFIQNYSRYTEKDYIMVSQDVRGRYMSEGTFEDIRPVIPVRKSSKDTDETTDTWDTVEWLVKNVDNNNGNVGIFGISYPGFYSTMGIINAHPAVKAVSPQAPVTAWFLGDDFHHNGAFFLLDCFPFYYSFGQPRSEPTRIGKPQFKWPVPDNYEFFLSTGPVKNLAPAFLGDSVKFWNDLFSHPDYDEFWKARDPRQHLQNVTPAVMTVGGWFDAEDLFGALKTYEAIEKQNSPSTRNHIVMGPWSHGQWASGRATNLGNISWGLDANERFIEQEELFFDHYLTENRKYDIPEALIFITGSNEWKNFDKWPPANIIRKELYFHDGEVASFTKPVSTDSYDEYVSDPMNPVPYTEDVHAARTTEYMTDDQRFASRRPDVMVYQTDVLTTDLTLTGQVTAGLFVSTTGTDADFIVKLIDVFPHDAVDGNPDHTYPMGGYQMLVRGEVFRGKYRNSFEKPEPFVPGRVTEVKFDLPDVAHTFKKGHRIMIQIQNSWFPLVDRNPQKFVNIYECSEEDFSKATQRIYHDSKFPSHLKVSILQ
ncbi:MAG: CocE/NonD family hydrolase [Bacteroidales bacterium]|jgi:putative CocE/NonD family hydrolase|nr:CocE/NonD family hydrolase [Bacteroidales bacterium]